ncbi:hypothetical protein GWI33_006816 [Rhynchophorus ferrugineus]|uniref:Uncharacterized protein n=1 Tax=Rhynchophorus ferrugineus TaxID=354439 RepID=A0A834II76_RHYFE|nr:hypothetical protein GWI33_006816 [Rhynchophorus ferrugineus]
MESRFIVSMKVVRARGGNSKGGLTGNEAFSLAVVSPLGGTCPALAKSPAGTRRVRQSGTSPHSHVVQAPKHTHR